MFGLDEETLDEEIARRARRRRRRKRLLVDVVLLALFTPCITVLGLIWLLLTPEGLGTLLEWTADRRPGTLTVGDIAIHPASVWDDPSTWKVVFSNVHILPDEDFRPRLHIRHAVLTMPDWERLWRRRELEVPEAWLVGMHIDARQQRSAPKRPRRPEALQLLVAERVHVWDAAYTAPPDDPLPRAEVLGIYGTLDEVRFDPFSREVDGIAHLAARSFRTGDLLLTHVRVETITANRSNLLFEGGQVRWEGHLARVAGRVDNIDERADVELEVWMTGAPVEGLVYSATGKPSPLYGVADVDILVRSGGELPRGGGYMDAHVDLRDAMIPLPSGTRGIYKDAIRLAPIATLDEKDQVHLEFMKGDLTLSRGTVKLHQLVYDAKIPVYVRGVVDGESLDLIVRMVLRGDPDTTPGFGLRLTGPHTAPAVTGANRDELLPGWREKKAEAKAERRAEGGRLRLRTPRWLRRDDDTDTDSPEDTDAP